jgi:hypothetical protein
MYRRIEEREDLAEEGYSGFMKSPSSTSEMRNSFAEAIRRAFSSIVKYFIGCLLGVRKRKWI